MFKSLPIVLGGLLLLSACAAPVGFEVRSPPADSSHQSAFDQGLVAGYWANTVETSGIDDNYASDWFGVKAKNAAKGQEVLPGDASTDIGSGHKPVHESQVNDITDARAKLMGFFDRGARDIRPEWAAKAQVALDCWIEESTEVNSRGGILETADMNSCKNDFNAAMAKIEPFLPPLQPAEHLKMFELMPDAPSPAVAGAPDTYLVFFDWNKSNLTPEALGIIRTAAANAKKSPNSKIDITGYADTSGQPDYNLKLSKRRADAVKAELVKQGIAAKNITTAGKGETELLVQTPDGVREPQNRRAKIVIQIR